MQLNFLFPFLSLQCRLFLIFQKKNIYIYYFYRGYVLEKRKWNDVEGIQCPTERTKLLLPITNLILWLVVKNSKLLLCWNFEGFFSHYFVSAWRDSYLQLPLHTPPLSCSFCGSCRLRALHITPRKSSLLPSTHRPPLPLLHTIPSSSLMSWELPQ